MKYKFTKLVYTTQIQIFSLWFTDNWETMKPVNQDTWKQNACIIHN